MNEFNKLFRKLAIAVVIMVSALMLGGCANVTSKQVPSISGVDTSSVNMFIDNDNGAVTLTGQVTREIDRMTIEEYVSNEYGYKNIRNHITLD